MNNKTTYRNSMIDILKAIGMILVIITHYSWSDDEELKYLFPFWVYPAVPIFIIISGYVYSMSYERNGIKTLSECYGYRFVINKIIRYTVPFVMAYAIEIIVSVFFNKMTIYDMVSNFIKGGVGPGSYYYPIMMQFIFVLPFIYCIVKKCDFFGIIVCFFINGMFEVLQRSYGMGAANYRLLVFRYIFLMSVGCYLYLGGGKKPKLIVGIMSMFFGACWLIAYCYLGYQPIVIIYWSKTSLLAALWIVPIVWVLLKNPKLSQIKCKPLEEMGKASYNIFLTQMVFFTYAVGTVYKIIPSRALQLIICILVSMLVGYIFYLIESKITNRISKICKEHDYWSANIHKAFGLIETMMTK